MDRAALEGVPFAVLLRCSLSNKEFQHLLLANKKVPAYNSLKACKGNMFFLPLPFSKTLETLENVEGVLADPELYIIVNNKPTRVM